mgnify:CR=1 FL=1
MCDAKQEPVTGLDLLDPEMISGLSDEERKLLEGFRPTMVDRIEPLKLDANQ